MTKRLFSTAKKRRPYRPRGYRSVFATDVDPETEEETTSEVSEEEVGLSADEFTGDLTDDPLADLADESIWAVTPGTDEDYSVTEDDFEREEAITNTSSRRVANDNLLDTLNPTGSVFVDYDPDSRASMELAPNIRPYSEVNGVDPDERMVVYRGVPPGAQTELADGDFITDMEQLAKDYAGYPHGDVISQEVFADEILDNMDEPGANEYLFRPRRASKKTANSVTTSQFPILKYERTGAPRKERRTPMTAIDRYLRYASRRGMDPQSKSTLRAFARSDRGTSKTAQRDISRWFVAQKVAHDTARDVLASSRNYRRKMSSSWHLDNKLSAYVSKVQQKFACSCGAKLDVPAYNICKCGKIWNAYRVTSATKGDTMYVVREIPVRENVLVAGRGKTASRRHAYDVEDDTYDFFEKARERGYRFPKNMGDDPDSGTFQDELYNYTGGDRDRMRQVTDFARDNWGQHRNFDPYY